MRSSRRRFAAIKIGAILEANFVLTLVPTYCGGAAERSSLGSPSNILTNDMLYVLCYNDL